MYGPETFVARMDGDAMAPLIRDRDHVYVDPDEPAAHGIPENPGRRFSIGPPFTATDPDGDILTCALESTFADSLANPVGGAAGPRCASQVSSRA